ncbi:Major facilitator superfamily transporter [Cordyceps militaris]|uniref:Major facilitator superfamily transporter n=1 Tax=Cordyceps militaris TaxID=73501 RepID=A0A2H4SEV8_CORMI|nr:Major facilitator superfamily transporter [Cordyceps militaris]
MKDEQRPLLRSAAVSCYAAPLASSSTSDNGAETRQDNCAASSSSQMPRIQLILLCFSRMMDPVVFCSIFPYIAAMVHRNTGLPVSDVGFYSGLVESLFAIVQTLALVLWARLADRLGRKTALVCSLAGTAVGSSLFGMATTLWQMYLFRSLVGLFAASNLITRTMISEGFPADTQPTAFGWLVFAANAGNFVGPMIGGMLTDPAQQYPDLFGSSTWLRENPYALAGIAVGVVSAFAALASLLWLQETQEAADGAQGTQMAPSELIKAPGVAITLAVYAQSKVLAVAVSAVLPVYLYTPARLGGMQLSPAEISMYMTVQGASQVFWLLVAFPFLNKRLGTQGLLSAIASFYMPVFAGYIIMNALLRSGGGVTREWLWLAVAPAMVSLGSAVIMAQTSVQLAVNDASPNAAALSGINALALVGNGAVRAVTPGAASAVFAAGVKNSLLAGYLVWVVLIVLAIVFRASVHWLPRQQDKSEGADTNDSP